MTDPTEDLYQQAAAANENVDTTGRAYHDATSERARLFRALVDRGQTFYRMAQRLGMSTTRVSQIVSPGKPRWAADNEDGDHAYHVADVPPRIEYARNIREVRAAHPDFKVRRAVQDDLKEN